MTIFKPVFLSLIALALPLSAAAFKGKVEFTPEEKELHKKGLTVIMSTAATCMKAEFSRHQSYFQRYGISAYYGTTSPFQKLTMDQRRSDLRQRGVPAKVADEMSTTSCVDYVARCLSAGFKAAKQDALYAKLRVYLRENGGDGSALQEGLRGLGWRLLYWNPDVNRNASWDREEREIDPKNSAYQWGYHASNWNSVRAKNRYYTNTVDDAKSLVNFGARVPAFLLKVPYFVASAHMGYHIFAGLSGQIYEAHASREITDEKTVERGPWNPLTATGTAAFRSGLIALPPGY